MEELALLLAALAKTAIQEGFMWSQGRTTEEIKKRRIEEEAKTDDLIDQMHSGG